MPVAPQSNPKFEKTHVDEIRVKILGLDGIDGELAARGFELSLAVNSIPTVSVDLLPVTYDGDYELTEASKPSFSDITDLYNRLLALSEKKDRKADIAISKPSYASSSENKADDDAYIELRGWILTDVGLSSVTSFSAPSLVAVFSHPICRLNRTGMLYSVPDTSALTAKLMTACAGASDVVSMMDTVYSLYAGGSIPFKQIRRKNGDKIDAFRKALGIADNKPGTYLSCPGRGLFMDKLIDGQLYPFFIAATAHIVKPTFGATTTWNRIVGTVCPTFLMQVVPTYDSDDGRLSLEPHEPWQKLSYTIDEGMVESISLPAGDPDPICGVASADAFPFPPDRMDRHNVTVTDQTGSPFAFYVPGDVDPGLPNGRVLEVQDNAMVATMLRCDVGFTRANGKIEEAEIRRTRTLHDQIGEKYAEAMFESVYRSGCTASVVASLSFADKDGKTIYPGRVMTVSGKGVGDKLFYGYLTRMKVSGSTGGRCRTVFELTTVRPAEEKGASRLVAEGTTNPCYR